MSTSTQAKKTTDSAKSTGASAKATARSAAADTKRTTTAATRRARSEAAATERGLAQHGKRVAAAAQAEVQAVAGQPQRPLLFALGVVDRTAAGVKALPSALLSTPSRARTRIVGVAATAGDLAEKAQRAYTDIAVDGENLLKSIRGQESTQRALQLAERAQRRGEAAVKDTEKALEVGSQAATEALGKIG